MLSDFLIKENWIKTPRIIKAFQTIRREDFLPQEFKESSQLNLAFPIGWGQSISQPTMAAFMLEKLQAVSGDKVLEIGTGCGWVTALLASIISQPGNEQDVSIRTKKGRVYSLEAIPELKDLALKNIAPYGFIEGGLVEFTCSDGFRPYPLSDIRSDISKGFDKILASASSRDLPKVWKDQLKIGGILVAPIGTSIWRITKIDENKFEEIEFPGFIFAPFSTLQQKLIRNQKE